MRQKIKSIVVGTPFEPMARKLSGLLSRAGLIREHIPQEDTWLIEIMKRVLRRDSNCIDVGSSVGAILGEMICIAPEGQHVAFEPLPHRAQELTTRFPQAQVMQLALSDEQGTSEFQHVIDNTGYSGLRQRKYPLDNMRVEKIQVRVDRLDAVLPKDRTYAFLKIDVEGAELQVLRGAENTLREHKPVVAFEHGLGASDFYGTTPQMTFDFFSQRGYKVFLLPTWLAGGSELSREDFVSQYGGKHCNFLAIPRQTSNARTA